MTRNKPGMTRNKPGMTRNKLGITHGTQKTARGTGPFLPLEPKTYSAFFSAFLVASYMTGVPIMMEA